MADSVAKETSRATGRWLVVAAALLWSTGGFFAKAPIFDNWPVESRGLALAFYRAVFAALVLLPFVRRVRWSWGLVPMTILFAAMNWTYLTALVQGPPANAIWLQNTAPAWVLIFSVWIFGEKLHRGDIGMIACCLAGVGTILTAQLVKEIAIIPTLLGLISGLFYAGVVLCLMRLRGEDPAFLVALNHVVTAITMIPCAFWVGSAPTTVQWLTLAAFGTFQMGLPYLLFTRGIKHTPGHEATLIALLEPILLPVWIYIAWSHLPDYQPPDRWTFIGGSLILAGLLFRYMPSLLNRSKK